MKHDKKLSRSEETAQQLNEQQAQSTGALEFGSAEEMLRHDARNTAVPPTVAHRLAESIAEAPAPSRAWWRRWLGT